MFYCQIWKFSMIMINIGPQHPSTHGVLRLITIINGETVKWITPEIGLLFRATEKLMEYNSLNASISYFDRLDYVSTISQETLFLSAIEKSLGSYFNSYSSNIRVLFMEISRVLNHLLAITTHAIDIGALNPLLWAFEEREKLMSFQETLSGSRMHTAFSSFPHSFQLLDLSLIGFRYDIPLRLLSDIYEWTLSFPIKLKELHNLLSNNKLWRDRLHEIGIIPRSYLLSMNLSGVLARSSGLLHDTRFINYEGYQLYKFSTYVTLKGDCLDRYLIRINECLESINIIISSLNLISLSSNTWSFYKQTGLSTRDICQENTIQSMILSYNPSLISFYLFNMFNLSFQECPKGIYSIFVITMGFEKPLRIDFTPNDFLCITQLNKISNDINIADLIAILGSIDFVLGSVDSMKSNLHN